MYPHYYPIMGTIKVHQPTRYAGNSYISMRPEERKRTNGSLDPREHGLVYCCSSLSSKSGCGSPQHTVGLGRQGVPCICTSQPWGKCTLSPRESSLHQRRIAHGCTAPSECVAADTRLPQGPPEGQALPAETFPGRFPSVAAPLSPPTGEDCRHPWVAVPRSDSRSVWWPDYSSRMTVCNTMAFPHPRSAERLPRWLPTLRPSI